jgi:predicted nuclease of predicted toxin-antitoxin system
MARATAAHRVTQPASARLVMDEMFSPSIAAALRDRGDDVIAVAERGELRAMTDEEVFARAISQGRWLLTENVKDFRHILLRALQTDTPVTGILFTSSRSFPRSRKNPGPLIRAIHAWMLSGPPEPPLTEDWLLNPTSR